MKKAKKSSIILLVFFSVLSGGILFADNWPTYMHDSSRTGITEEKTVFPMKLAWKYTSEYAPSPSWPKPAKQDYWHAIPNLAPTTIFDRAFHTISFSDKVAFSSSTDNNVYCLDAKSGAITWKFISNGPVRLAPYYLGKKIYVASDDGFLYCLNADNGKEIWKYWAGGKSKRYLPGNNRMISRWPIRAGIMSDEKYLYFAAGLFVQDKVFLCAIDLKTGKEKYKVPISVPAQGYMSLHNDRLYIPVGRTAQIAFNKADGSKVFKLFPGGTSSVYNQLVFSGENEKGEAAIYSATTKKIIARLKARQIIVHKNKIFLLQNNSVAAVDKKAFLDSSKKMADLLSTRRRTKEQNKELNTAGQERTKSYLWTSSVPGNKSMILSSDTLFLGCDEKVIAISTNDGKKLWGYKTDGNIYGLNATDKRIIASSDTGSIYCFIPGKQKKKQLVPFNPFESNIDFSKNKKFKEAAQTILKKAKFTKGYCYIYDFGNGELAYEIAKRSDLAIIGFDKNAVKIAKTRAKFAKLGLYGKRVSIYNASDKIQFQPKTGNIITSGNSFISGKLPAENINELFKLTRPNGGTIVFLLPVKSTVKPKKINSASSPWSKSKNSAFKIYSLKRKKLKNSGEWTHSYANPGATACSNDKLIKGDLEIQWFGLPGPERIADRHFRSMPPLFSNGNLFVLGNNYLYGVDAYNGTVLWEHIIPRSLRLRMMYDTGIMTADKDLVYVGSNDKCLAISSRSGKIVREFKVPYKDQQWGYVSIIGNNLIGSGQLPGTTLNTFYRINGSKEGDFKPLACSRNLFSYNSDSGKLNWKYKKGIIINPTIVQGDGKIFFVETNYPKLLKSTSGRFGLQELIGNGKASLVALNEKTGKEVWRKAYSSQFRHVIFLCYADGMLLASGSFNDDKYVKYSITAYNAVTGKEKWTSDSSPKGRRKGGSHGEQFQRPAIINGKIFLFSHVKDLKTGKKVENQKGWRRSGRGCGTISASADAIFSRGNYPVIWDISSARSKRLSLETRPGCWINIIPAGGLVLIPEASSGCTCGYSIQASIALAPASD